MQAVISPEIVKWAQKRANMASTRLSSKFKKIRSWENGESRPTLRQARDLAAFLHIPFGFLYLSQPPEEKLPIPDLRTIKKADHEDFSAEFMDTLYSIIRKQQAYKELVESQEAGVLPFIGRFNLAAGIKEIAIDISATLGIDDRLRAGNSSWSGYLTAMVKRAEDAGILVFRNGVVGNNTHRSLSVEEFKGFAISDPVAPAIFINAKDYITSRIFTCAHEIAHLWFGESGISNFEEGIPSENVDIEIEKICDKIAVEVLVPESDFISAWGRQSQANSTTIGKIAGQFHVSTIVILRRAFELNKISKSSFFELLKIERAQVHIQKENASGGDFKNNFFARNGSRFTSAIFEALAESRILYREAASLLDVKVTTIPRLLKGI